MAKKKNIVKKARGTMNLLVIAMIACGWLLALTVITGDGGAAEQKAMIDSAKVFLEDRLYVRAIGRYKEALKSYQTPMNPVYEEELLEIYQDAGMIAEYYSLIDSRINGGRASAEEYLERAGQYIESGSGQKAMTLLQQGMAVWEDERLSKLYESVSYSYSALTLPYREMQMPFSNWYIPAYNGKTWDYVSVNGRLILSGDYQEATPFSGGYAVVKISGVYTLIDEEGYWNAVDKNGLEAVTALAGTRLAGRKDGQYGVYTNTFQRLGSESYEDICLNDNGLILAKRGGKWALLNSGLDQVTEYCFTDVARNSRGQAFSGGFAAVADEGGYFLIDTEGKACFTQRFAGAKGMEGGLLAVQDGAGKWGFADRQGLTVIACEYEDAHSFSDRLGAVKKDGKWGYINKDNDMMLEAAYENALPFREGRALAADGLGNYRILTLKSYSLF